MRDRWAVEGSYELNPTWQAEIDSGRRFTRRLVVVGILLAALLLAMRWVVDVGEMDPALFAVGAGAVLLLQAPTLIAHASNLQMFRDLADPTAITGSVTFSRWLTLRQAGWFLVRFAVLWLVLWVPSQQAFFLGGALSCLLFARRLAAQALRPPGSPGTPGPSDANR